LFNEISLLGKLKKIKIMVTVSNYAVRTRKDGSTFITLELTGGVELCQSSSSGSFYATVRKCNVPSTFNEQVAKSIIGQKIPGEIIRVQCEPYEWTNKNTGEVITLQHSYGYRPQGSVELIGETKVDSLDRATV
jgi:hypothetical protein